MEKHFFMRTIPFVPSKDRLNLGGYPTRPSFKNGFKIFIGFMFMILSVVFGASLNYETSDLQLKVFVCFLAFLHGVFILIQVNDKSAT